MVGKRTVKPWCRIIGDLLNRPYKLGEVDCFRSILEYVESLGVYVPQSFEGQTLETYPDYFRDEPEAAKQTAVRLFNALLIPVDPKLTLPGDVMLLQYKDNPPFLAINGGNGTVVTASKECGFRSYSGSRFQRLKGWSCQQLFR